MHKSFLLIFFFFQKYSFYQPPSFLEESKSTNILVRQYDERCLVENSNIWNIGLNSSSEFSVNDVDESRESFGDNMSTYSSLTPDLNYNLVTQGSISEVSSNTKDNLKTETIDKVSPKVEDEPWNSTTVRTSQQQIIDCIVDQMCFTDSKVDSDWTKNKELPFELETLNNNVYESYSQTHTAPSCCNPSGEFKSLALNSKSSQDQDFTELPINHSNLNLLAEENMHTNENEFIIVNSDSNYIVNALQNDDVESSHVAENAIVLEVKTGSVREDLVPEYKYENYEIQVLETKENVNFESAFVEVTHSVPVNSVELIQSTSVSSTENQNKELLGNVENYSEGEQPNSLPLKKETVTENNITDSNCKPARACKGVRYREFMSTNQLGKRRGRQKHRYCNSNKSIVLYTVEPG